MSYHRFVDRLFLFLFQSQLNGIITIRFHALSLDYHTRAGLDYGHRNQPAGGIKYLCHSDFLPKNSLRQTRHLPTANKSVYSLISISTPAGRSRRIKASTVLELGSKMSINLLWVLISNCSRESLSL